MPLLLPQPEPIETSCFELDTAGNGTGFGRYVKMYTSRAGITLSAALRHDYMGWGWPNAPATTNGREELGKLHNTSNLVGDHCSASGDLTLV